MRRRYLEIVYIQWIDSEADIGWEELPTDLPTLEVNCSVGFLAAEDLEKYVLGGDYDRENDHFNRRMTIPKACVKKVRTLTIVPLKQRVDEKCELP